MNKTDRIKLIAAMFRLSDCGTICYTTDDVRPESVELKYADWDGGDVPFRGCTVPHVYALNHLTEPEVEMLHEYAREAINAGVIRFGNMDAPLHRFWERPENADFECVFNDVYNSLNTTPDEMLRLKPGDEYWIEADWSYAELG